MTQPLQIIEAKTVANGDQWHVYLADANGRKIAALWGSQDEKMENARLFKAAGDMLEALQAIRSGVISGAVGGEDVVWFDEITTLYEFCDEIIARATGAGEARESR